MFVLPCWGRTGPGTMLGLPGFYTGLSRLVELVCCSVLVLVNPKPEVTAQIRQSSGLPTNQKLSVDGGSGFNLRNVIFSFRVRTLSQPQKAPEPQSLFHHSAWN